MTTDVTIGVDIGGSRIKAGAVTAAGELVARAGIAKPRTESEAYEAVAGVIQRLRHEVGGVVRAAGLAVAGFISADRSRVSFAPHLPWRDAAVADTIAQMVGLPVVMDHDVNCAAWAEYRRGAATGAQTALMMALGTGIGAGLVTAGALYRGAFGTAPEFGHLVLVPGGRPCSCGKSGCLERYCSGTGLVTTAAELAGVQNPGFVLSDLPWSSGAEVAAAARGGDRLASAAVEDLAEWLGRGLAMACDLFDPDVIVIGGGVAGSADLYLERAREIMAATVTGAGYRMLPRVVPASFGASAAIRGAALLAAEETR